jgi:hypothetical protein
MHDTACGPDDIHYQLLKNLPESALQVILDLMNDIWETGDLPYIGQESIGFKKPYKVSIDHPFYGFTNATS